MLRFGAAEMFTRFCHIRSLLFARASGFRLLASGFWLQNLDRA
jgi:hypothetical protein